jgi:KipI family sensor histidine kinase inhibitor
MRVLPYGDTACLLEPQDPSQVLALAALLRDRPGVAEVVPGARTLLVRGDASVLAALATLEPPPPAARPAPSGAEVVLDVRYDGPDLASTAGELGLSADELADRHAAGRYVVAFCGFAPGFAYLRGLEPALQVGRRPEPRTRVPAGSVAIAGEFTGVYPQSSPGGWRLVGTTDAVLWDLHRTPPALLPPGTRVRFRRR